MSEGSRRFTDPAWNRDSLVPAPIVIALEQLVQRAVGAAGASAASEFSASRGHPVYPIMLPSRCLSLSLGELAPGARTSNHRHAYESLVYVIEGAGHTLIEQQRLTWAAGDAFYIPPWNWHRHAADHPNRVRYLTATNLPLLAQLGQTVVREEE